MSVEITPEEVGVHYHVHFLVQDEPKVDQAFLLHMGVYGNPLEDLLWGLVLHFLFEFQLQSKDAFFDEVLDLEVEDLGEDQIGDLQCAGVVEVDKFGEKADLLGELLVFDVFDDFLYILKELGIVVVDGHFLGCFLDQSLLELLKGDEEAEEEKKSLFQVIHSDASEEVIGEVLIKVEVKETLKLVHLVYDLEDLLYLL